MARCQETESTGISHRLRVGRCSPLGGRARTGGTVGAPARLTIRWGTTDEYVRPEPRLRAPCPEWRYPRLLAWFGGRPSDLRRGPRLSAYDGG